MDQLDRESLFEQAEATSLPAASFWRQLCCSFSVFLWLGVVLILVLQPDILVAIVLIPPWCWVIAGLLLALTGWERASSMWSLLAILLWGLFTVVFVDESCGVWRAGQRVFSDQAEATLDADLLRVASLNCAGSIKAAEELIPHKPDVLLLQEAPGRRQVSELTKSLFGSTGGFLHKGDTAIIANGDLTDVTPDHVSSFGHAKLRFLTGQRLDVVSLRLTPPVFRMDFWSSGFWSDHRDRRMEHRIEIGKLTIHLRRTASTGPLVLGGDFNTTPIDRILNRLRSRVFDTFGDAGRGWGNTGTSSYPLFRVDQIWASYDIKAVSTVALETENSDHRMVLSDLVLPVAK